MWLSIALSYAKKKFGRTLKIYFYLTKIKKQLPDNNLQILSHNHCNSAVTTSCDVNGEILIFREEEWFKVLIHETFHSLCLDFSTMPSYIKSEFNKEIRSIMPVKSSYNLFESYSEFWACVWNCAFCSYHLGENTFKTFVAYFDFCIQTEILFSIFQMNKVLKFMGLQYELLYDKEESNLSTARNYLYREKTNVFAYYIMKTVLLYHHVEFMEWCDIHNGLSLIQFRNTKLNLMDFAKFIKEKYNDSDMISVIKLIRDINEQDSNEIETYKTLRMSVCELEE